jgi:hypothetical protein
MTKIQAFRNEATVLYIAVALIISVLAWSVGFGLWIRHANALAPTSVSDTLSDSDVGVGANHVISWTNATATTAGGVIRVTFDPLTDRFDGVQSVTTSTLLLSGATLASACGAGGDEVTLTTSTAAGDESIILTVCAGDTVAAGTLALTVTSTVLTNPTSSGSYVIRIDNAAQDYADTRVAIIDDVVVTASVDTSFTFVISSLPTGTTINGVTTTYFSATTSLAFGTLPVAVPITLGQGLSVSTNAANGFSVTVRNDQPLLSSTGADIDYFFNGDATSTPVAWAAPTGVIDEDWTYGHIGLTSEDADLNGDEFGSALFAGNFSVTSTREVFSHDGPSNGTQPDAGYTEVAYRIQITALQEAGTDYSNTLTYVATPTF